MCGRRRRDEQQEENDAVARTSEEDMEKQLEEEVVLGQSLRRQNSCFARMLFLCVIAIAAFFFFMLYASPAELLEELTTELGRADSGVLHNDEAPGNLNAGTKDGFDVVDWVESGGKTPEHISKDDPRYDYWLSHHENDAHPGIGFEGGGKAGGNSAGNFAPFYPKKWRNSDVRLKDGKKFEVVKQLKHDPHAFLEGLAYYNGYIYESTGLKGQSSIRRLDPDTGEILESYPLPSSDVFGEGLTIFNGKAVQLTYKKKTGYIYDLNDLKNSVKNPDTFKFETTSGEGWGMTYWEKKNQLIVSDGSNTLLFWDADTMKEVSRLEVKRESGWSAKQINELEMWHGSILANVWYKDQIWAINPHNGNVTKEYDFDSLWPIKERRENKAGVLNGIARARDPNLIYVTGKNWDRMFLVKLNF